MVAEVKRPRLAEPVRHGAAAAAAHLRWGWQRLQISKSQQSSASKSQMFQAAKFWGKKHEEFN